MNLESLIKRAEKAIKKKQASENSPSIFESEDGLFPESFNGLVVVYDNGVNEG